MKSEAFRYVLKQYYKGKNDNINYILLSLRELIIEKCKKHNINPEEIDDIVFLVIHGVDSYSLEKAISFDDYMDIYIDMAFTSYKETLEKRTKQISEYEFVSLFSNSIKQSLEENKTINLKLG